mmetsp:Transcript_1501/g.3056  ORF Transcript_1501/g.3056 Transcript_1501/m.3056 type:complete len:249 (+) Transcript_1501:145-891(+)
MPEEPRQRRGKKDGESAVKTKEELPINRTPVDQLLHAQARLVVARDRTADLHTAWRNQLFRLSLLVTLICLHALQSPTSSCISDIKDFNAMLSSEEGGSGKPIRGFEVIRLLFGETFCELLGVITAFLLTYFLALCRGAPQSLDHWTYIVSSALVPMQLGFFFHSKHLGCLRGYNGFEFDETSEKAKRQFPVVVIYHTIVTFAFWFMKSGMETCEEHLKMATDSLRDCERMDKKIEQKKGMRVKSRKK